MFVTVNRKLNGGFSVFVPFVLVLFIATGCGAKGSGASRNLDVHLTLPPGEVEELFWYGVTEKKVRYYRGSEMIGEHSWRASDSQQIDLNEGDRVVFQGEDSRGKILVRGEAVVGNEKSISIMAYRLL